MSYVAYNKCPPRNPVTWSEPRQLIEKLCATMKFKKSFISKCFFSERSRLAERYQFYFPLWLPTQDSVQTTVESRQKTNNFDNIDKYNDIDARISILSNNKGSIENLFDSKIKVIDICCVFFWLIGLLLLYLQITLWIFDSVLNQRAVMLHS